MPFHGAGARRHRRPREIWGAPVWAVLEICPRGNNKVVIIIFHVHDKVYTPWYNCINRKHNTCVVS